MKKHINKLVVLCCLGVVLTSCKPVKEYQKGKINDSEMALAPRKIEKTEMSFQSYREGSAGASAGKVGGGCGCN